MGERGGFGEVKGGEVGGEVGERYGELELWRGSRWRGSGSLAGRPCMKI